MSVGLIEEKDIQKQLDELPEASRVWVEGLLASVAELEEQSSKDSKQEETLNQSLAELNAQYVELHDYEMEAPAQLGKLYASVEQMSSTLSHPCLRAIRHICSPSQCFRKHQLTNDCFSRPRRAVGAEEAAHPPRATSDPCNTERRVICFMEFTCRKRSQ